MTRQSAIATRAIGTTARGGKRRLGKSKRSSVQENENSDDAFNADGRKRKKDRKEVDEASEKLTRIDSSVLPGA